MELKRKYLVSSTKSVRAKQSGNSGGVGLSGRRRKKGWRKHGKTPANAPEIKRKMRFLERNARSTAHVRARPDSVPADAVAIQQ